MDHVVTSSEAPASGASNEPLVSVALPVYNGENYLVEALESILSQTVEDLELIVADNASTDGTAEICQDYADGDSRIRYFRQATNVGAAPNFNFAFRQARGRYFKWAACDDALEPRYLERCVAVLEDDDRVSLAHTGVICIDEHGNESGTFELDRTFAAERPFERFRNLMTAYDFSAIWGLMRREMVARTALLPVYLGADRLFLTEIALKGRPVFLDEMLFRWRIHGGSYREKQMGTKNSSVSWWSTSVRSWPLRNTACLLTHGTGIVLRSPMPFGEKLKCEGLFLGWSLRPLVLKLLSHWRRGAPTVPAI